MEDNGGRIRVDNKEEEILYSFKIDSGRFVVVDKIIFYEKFKISLDIFLGVVNSQEEDFRIVFVNRKNRNINGLKDFFEDKIGNESSDILSDWRIRR